MEVDVLFLTCRFKTEAERSFLANESRSRLHFRFCTLLCNWSMFGYLQSNGKRLNQACFLTPPPPPTGHLASPCVEVGLESRPSKSTPLTTQPLPLGVLKGTEERARGAKRGWKAALRAGAGFTFRAIVKRKKKAGRRGGLKRVVVVVLLGVAWRCGFCADLESAVEEGGGISGRRHVSDRGCPRCSLAGWLAGWRRRRRGGGGSASEALVNTRVSRGGGQ